MGNKSLLDTLKFPQDLKSLQVDELDQLAQEIRTRLLEIGDRCGGHLASNLGVVELTLVLHTLFDSPNDKFIFDTSHQTYVHKMLTGRLDKMFTIRQDGGLSGFAKIDESEHDIFGAGHASTALSAGLGVAHARDILQQDYSVVSVIGDASLSGGMAFEALNNAQQLNSNFICILNDNDMSISEPVGNMASYMTKIRTSGLYDNARKTFESIVTKIPKIGNPLLRSVVKMSENVREILFNSSAEVMFEEFGFRYIGPIDGHNIPMLMLALNYAKTHPSPILIHITTKKGKGYNLAEENPTKYHGVSPKPTETPSKTVSAPSFSQTFGSEMIDICHDRPDVAVITPAMEGGSGLTEFAKVHPNQYFDVGIAEEHAVTFAAGLARAGVKPVLAIYSTFLQRGYDQLIHDVCLQKLPVVFALDRAGLVGPDGPTHHGVFDYNFMLPIPHLTIMAPKDVHELKAMLRFAVDHDQAISIRYPKAFARDTSGYTMPELEFKKPEILCGKDSISSPKNIVVISTGTTSWSAYDAAQIVKHHDISVTVVHLRFIKPISEEALKPILDKASDILVVEEGQQIGGVFSYLLSTFHNIAPNAKWHSLGIDDNFVTHGQISTLLQSCELDVNGIVNKLKSIHQLSSSKSSINDSSLAQ